MKTNLLKHVIFTTLTVPALAACGGGGNEYVITDKGANKLIFRSLSEPYYDGILECSESQRFYQVVNVGDTITGVFPKGRSATYVHDDRPIPVGKINGRRIHEVMFDAECDSLVVRTRREIQRTK